MPSSMMFSAGVGTYWFHMGSPGFLMRSRAAGVIRRLKASMALSTSFLSMFSSPKRSTRSSTVVRLCFRICCQLSIRIRSFRSNDEKTLA